MEKQKIRTWEWIIFSMAILTLITCIYIQLTAPSLLCYLAKNNVKWISFEDIFNEAENGDIILMAGDTYGERVCRWTSGSIFSHVGFLFWEFHPFIKENVLYIFDCDVGQNTKDGVRIMPLQDKLHQYKGFRTAALKKLIVHKPTRRPSHDQITELFPRYISNNLDHRMVTWCLSDWPQLCCHVKKDNEMFCSELVASIYQDLGILKKNRVPTWYHPGDFYQNTLHLENGFSLGSTLFFKFPLSFTQEKIDKSSSIETGMDNWKLSNLPGLQK